VGYTKSEVEMDVYSLELETYMVASASGQVVC
jgi:hypothetical protein